MTCICGFTEKRGNKHIVHMIGDACGSSDVIRLPRNESKVFLQKPNNLLMGYAGSFRIGQIARHSLKKIAKRSKDQDLNNWMCNAFVSALRKVLKNNDITDNEIDSVFLVGIEGKLFTINQDFHVSENIYPYVAIGSTDVFAYGALRAMHRAGHSGKECVEAAIEAAAEFSGSVMPPFTYIQKIY